MTFFEALPTAFFPVFLAFPAFPPLTAEATFRPAFLLAFLTPLEAAFPALRAVFGAFRAVLAAFLPAGRAVFRAAFMAFLAGAAALAPPLGSTAPIADRMRLISRVTCSMVIMPSTVKSFRRSE